MKTIKTFGGEIVLERGCFPWVWFARKGLEVYTLEHYPSNRKKPWSIIVSTLGAGLVGHGRSPQAAYRAAIKRWEEIGELFGYRVEK